MDLKEVIKTGFLLIVLGYVAYSTTYTVHEKYHLPFHSDEWDHLTLGKELTKTGSIESIKKVNPYIGIPYTSYWVNQESGFHLFTALLLDHTDLPVEKFGVVIPTIISFILALNAFVLVRYLTESLFAGLTSAVFSVTIKSNVTFLGPWFFVPSSVGLAFAPMFLYLFLRALYSKKIFNEFDVIFTSTFIVAGLFHPPSVTALIPVFCLYLILNHKILREKKEKFILAAAVGFVLFIAMLFVFNISLSLLSNPISFLSRYLVFTGSDYKIKIMYSYPAYLGWGVISLAILGVYTAISSENRKEWILPVAVISLLPLAVQFYHTGKVFLSPYRRIFFYVAEILLLSAGLGLYYLYREAFNFIKTSAINMKVKVVLDVFVIVLVFYILSLQIDSTFKNADKLYHVIDEGEIEPLYWVKESTPEGAIFITKPEVSQAFTPIAERKIVAKPRTFLRVTQERIDDVNTFFTVGCSKKKQIIEKYDVSYVFGPEISCNFLHLIHSSGGDYIYKVDLN